MMLRIDSGEDLIPTLEALAFIEGWTDAFVTGAGVIDLAELQGHRGQSVTVDDAELMSLSGSITRRKDRCEATLRCTVLSEGKLHAGRIVSAVTGEMTLVLDAQGGNAAAAIRRVVSEAPATQASPAATSVARSPSLPNIATAPTAPAMPSAPGVPMAPSVPSAASSPTTQLPQSADGQRSATKPLSQSFSTKPVLRRIPTTPHDAGEIYAEDVLPGDVLDHPQLGMCEVVGEDDDGGTQVRVPSGRIRTLKLEALRILPSDREPPEGKSIYRIDGPQRR